MKKMMYAGFLIVCIFACALPFIRADHDVAFDDMSKQVQSLASSKDFKAQDEAYVRKQYELLKSDYDDIVCYGVPSAMEVNEFTVVKAIDEEKRSYIQAKLQSRIDRQYKSFSGYAPRQADLLKKAVLYERGDYVIMIVHKDAADMKEHIDALF